jgi:hypothetical protein
MITSLRSGEIDMAIGLTEGWIAGLGKAFAEAAKRNEKSDGGYRLVGTYVDSPLCKSSSESILEVRVEVEVHVQLRVQRLMAA